MSRGSILRRCAAVRELAERGAPGEREAAEQKLLELMEHHGITDYDLESRAVELYWFRYRDAFEDTLLRQVIAMHRGSSTTVVYDRPGRRNQYGIECTQAEKLEIELDFEFYLRAAKEELQIFWQAFMHKHRIYPPNDAAVEGEAPEMTAHEAMKMMLMEWALDKHTRPGMIGGGNDGYR